MARDGRAVMILLSVLLIAMIASNTAIGSSDISPIDTVKIMVSAITEKLMLGDLLHIEKVWSDSQGTIIMNIRLP
ncbi:MAG: hypothetical protein GQ576_05655, partial [Methanococcoides sp.]|nr:hypothetical protein [Methanococcoides sp.]